MTIHMKRIDQALFPIKGYADACRRISDSFSCEFVRESFNYPLNEICSYVELGIGKDPKGRYAGYAGELIRIFSKFQDAGMPDVSALFEQVKTAAGLEAVSNRIGMDGVDIAVALKFLIYWFLPARKPLNSLGRDYDSLSEAGKKLRAIGITSNLDLLDRGSTPQGRAGIARESGLTEKEVLDFVRRADFSRMPWANKATISNIMGAGFFTMDQFVQCDPEMLVATFLRYGKTIGKNLKLGNEIENSQRIARIIPKLVKEA